MILDAFYRKGDEAQWDIEEAFWLSCLDGLDAPHILKGWAIYQKPTNQGGGLRNRRGFIERPNPWDIRKRAIGEPKRPPALRPDPAATHEDRTPVTAQAANKIMAEAGFDAEHSRRVKRFPRRPKREDLDYSLAAVPKKESWVKPVDPEELARARDGNAVIEAAHRDNKKPKGSPKK